VANPVYPISRPNPVVAQQRFFCAVYGDDAGLQDVGIEYNLNNPPGERLFIKYLYNI
jgi:hypothetical protein